MIVAAAQGHRHHRGPLHLHGREATHRDRLPGPTRRLTRIRPVVLTSI